MGRRLSDAELLSLWERCSERHPIDRAIFILQAIEPEGEAEGLGELALGERNLRLMRAYRDMFGQPLAGITSCAACNTVLEFDIPADVLETAGRDTDKNQPPQPEINGYHLALRALDSRDMAAAARCTDAAAAAALLLSRSVVRSARGEEPVAPEDLPNEVKSGVSEWLSRRDPLADLTLELTCPECGRSNETAIEIVEFVWSAIAHAASRLIAEIALLARTFGWQEEQILAMTPARRRAYLDLGGAG